MLTPEQIARIYEVVDRFQLNRDWVVVPLAGSDAEGLRVLPDGKILVQAPGDPKFEEWFRDFPRRLGDLDLSRTARAWHPERYRCTIPGEATPASGARRYLHFKPAPPAPPAPPPPPKA